MKDFKLAQIYLEHKDLGFTTRLFRGTKHMAYISFLPD
jgi:hypothetical protein